MSETDLLDIIKLLGQHNKYANLVLAMCCHYYKGIFRFDPGIPKQKYDYDRWLYKQRAIIRKALTTEFLRDIITGVKVDRVLMFDKLSDTDIEYALTLRLLTNEPPETDISNKDLIYYDDIANFFGDRKISTIKTEEDRKKVLGLLDNLRTRTIKALSSVNLDIAINIVNYLYEPANITGYLLIKDNIRKGFITKESLDNYAKEHNIREFKLEIL